MPLFTNIVNTFQSLILISRQFDLPEKTLPTDITSNSIKQFTYFSTLNRID